MQRNGKIGSGFGLVDNLTYSYTGNRLSQITDTQHTNNNNEFVQRGSASYSYYADGSLKTDANEQILNISYDTFIKQPIQVTLTDGRWYKNYYDGNGFLYKTVYYSAANALIETWEYLPGGLVLKNGQPYQMSIPEGRAIYIGGGWQYEFDYKDHLGNTRVSFKANGNQLEQTAKSDFEPFGLKLSNSVANSVQNRWEMQGKASEQTFGLNRIDLGARTVNPLTVVWDRVDIMAEKYNSFSPYNYVLNNPLKVIDPNGNENIVISGGEYNSENRYKYNFIESAIKRLKDYKKQGEELTSWLVFTAGYSENDIEKYKKLAAELDVNFVAINSKEELTNYINSKDKTDVDLSEERTKDKITDLSVFAHGHKNDISFGYRQGEDVENRLSYRITDISKLNKAAFNNTDICLYSCNAATNLGGNSSTWNSIAGVMALQLNANVTGFHGRTNYATINEGESYGNKLNRVINGFNTNGSVSLPSRGTQTNGATSVIYNFNGTKIKK